MVCPPDRSRTGGLPGSGALVSLARKRHAWLPVRVRNNTCSAVSGGPDSPVDLIASILFARDCFSRVDKTIPVGPGRGNLSFAEVPIESIMVMLDPHFTGVSVAALLRRVRAPLPPSSVVACLALLPLVPSQRVRTGELGLAPLVEYAASRNRGSQ